MNSKTSTKEKFNVITIAETNFSANMTADFEKLTYNVANENTHLVINLEEVETIAPEICHTLAKVQQAFYEKDCSFVICCLAPEVEAIFEKEQLMELMNITPTESEAWDIVNMEEIERDLMKDFEE